MLNNVIFTRRSRLLVCHYKYEIPKKQKITCDFVFEDIFFTAYKDGQARISTNHLSSFLMGKASFKALKEFYGLQNLI